MCWFVWDFDGPVAFDRSCNFSGISHTLLITSVAFTHSLSLCKVSFYSSDGAFPTRKRCWLVLFSLTHLALERNKNQLHEKVDTPTLLNKCKYIFVIEKDLKQHKQLKHVECIWWSCSSWCIVKSYTPPTYFWAVPHCQTPALFGIPKILSPNHKYFSVTTRWNYPP